MPLLLLLGCSPEGEAPDGPVCDPEDVGGVERLPALLPDGSEGVAVWGGRLHVSVPSGVKVIDGDRVDHLVTLDHALGLAPGEEGLWVADPGEFTFDGSGSDGALVLVRPDGSARAVGGSLANPNAVAVAPWGEVLVSDDTRAEIVAVDPSTGEVRTWVEAVPSPNGLAFSPDGRWLYTVSTFVLDPALWRIPVDAQGAAGEPEEVTRFATGSAPDGVAVDGLGQVWVALNLAGELARVDPESGRQTRVALGLESPASLAFGTGPGLDPCSVYVTELFGTGLVRVTAGVSAP